jgi:hypothetical protein
MQKYTSKNTKSFAQNKKDFNARAINRFQGNATRLEHINNRNKKKSKKG